MLFERPMSLVSVGISLAIMIPECKALLEQPNQVPGPALLAGAVIGAGGIYLGSALASSYNKTLGRTVRLTMWGLLGLGISIGTIYFGLRAPETSQKMVFLGAGCLPLLAYAVSVLRGSRGWPHMS